ncbi:hypothetical protein PAMP_018919 [Pampus punctatissimus]
MRAIVLLCLLHAAFGGGNYSWNGPVQTTMSQAPSEDNACLTDQTSCGCCLMQTQIKRMERFFNMSQKEMNKKLTKVKMVLNNLRASRSAFSVALNNDNIMNCNGLFTINKNIVYKHVFLNLGGGYDVQTGIFTVPRSGVYSFAVTVYGNAALFGGKLSSCATVQVNMQEVATLLEKSGLDLEDSATVFLAMKLNAGDQVAVNLLKECSICDNNNHYNTFTGFLLYSTDNDSKM